MSNALIIPEDRQALAPVQPTLVLHQLSLALVRVQTSVRIDTPNSKALADIDEGRRLIETLIENQREAEIAAREVARRAMYRSWDR